MPAKTVAPKDEKTQSENDTGNKTQPRSQAAKKSKKGVRIERLFTTIGVNPLDEIQYEKRSSVISNPDGSVVFRMDDAEVPTSWSQLATDIVVSKYFRKAGVPESGHETSARQVVYRVAHTIREGGESLGGYFASEEDADAFEAELTFFLINQRAAFNSPVWFNCGLFHDYGIDGSGGNWYWDPETGQIKESTDAYSHPQCSACFIQSVKDDLMSIFELIKNEARLFKYGSGTGSNFSPVRSRHEKLSGGGTSSGLMSFLEVFDRGAGATKSGGTTRRAAKMVCLDMDHPEIMDFINWKRKEELKVKALIDAGYPSDFNGEAYKTVAGQNSNNSVRIPDEFMQAYLNGEKWHTRFRTKDEICETYEARDVMQQIAEAAWACADPGVQFDTTINDWHTCANTGRINSSNPCSEYMFLDDSACNLASINLVTFLKENGSFDIEGYRHACRIFILAQEILVDFASYPTEQIGQNSHDYRPLGLGYANLGTLLMLKGIPYDSQEAVSMGAALTAIMTGHAYKTSSEIAAVKGPFAGFAKNRNPMLRVMEKHRNASYKIDPESCSSDLLQAAREDWDAAVELGEHQGYRNSQTTVIAPTGTIGLLMDCDTTGIEPDFALVKFKKLAGGGYFKIINQAVPRALKMLGYNQHQVPEIIRFITGTLSLKGAPYINVESLKSKGFTDEDLEKVEDVLSTVFEFSFAFSAAVLGEETLTRLGYTTEETSDFSFNLLDRLGFAPEEIEEAGDVVCGRMTIEGAPFLKEEHLAVFDCANKCGKYGQRFIEAMAHVRMMAGVQKFISGAISKTVNLPHESTVEEIKDIYVESWRLGVKAVALYRDGCKLSQPLSATFGDKKDSEKDDDGKGEAETTEVTPRLKRRRLPKKRGGFTQEAKVGGHKIYLRTGEYEDGGLGELFIDMHKEGASFRSMMNCFAIAVSLGLQYGVPLKEYVDCFTYTRFEPQGMVDHANIKRATSVVDYMFRLLGMEYLGMTHFAQVKPADGETEDLGDSGKGTSKKKVTGEKVRSAVPPKGVVTPAPQTAVKEVKPSTQEAQAATVQVDASKAVADKPEQANASWQSIDTLSEQLSTMMGDAPFCDVCGHITVRSGSCYKCLNCGNSMGCS